MNNEGLIVIIGNGFDLAHGLKTGYNHFADHYIGEIVKKVEELLFSFGSKNKTFFKPSFIESIVPLLSSPRNSTKTLISTTINAYRKNDYTDLHRLLINNPSLVREIISNNFLGGLYADNYYNWFDIENTYFKKLKILNRPKPYSINIKEIKELNSEFDFIRKELTKYLKTIEIKKNDKIINFFKTFSRAYKDIYFINFNYTNTIEYYLDVFEFPKTKVNYIHGNLENDNIIFGYGNDQNEDYQELKKLEIDEFLEHFKTFEYLRDNNYQNIFEEGIEDWPYEVFVIGHSLGTTDKTLLDSIFNSEYCKRIYLFKRLDQKDKPKELYRSYRTLNFAASRVISNEKELRKKVVNFEDSRFFPATE